MAAYGYSRVAHSLRNSRVKTILGLCNGRQDIAESVIHKMLSDGSPKRKLGIEEIESDIFDLETKRRFWVRQHSYCRPNTQNSVYDAAKAASYRNRQLIAIDALFEPVWNVAVENGGLVYERRIGAEIASIRLSDESDCWECRIDEEGREKSLAYFLTLHQAKVFATNQMVG